MKKNIWEQKGKICLNLGCGLEVKKGFINVDKFYTYEQLTSNKDIFKQAKIDKDAKYIQADILTLPFKNEYADYVELMNVIEHFPMRTVVNYVKEIWRVMKSGASMIIVTNSMDGLCVDWLNMAAHRQFDPQEYKNVAETIYGSQFAEGELHRCPFTVDFMNHVLSQAGFKTGGISIFRKNDSVPTFGSVKPFRKGLILRNDLIYAEVTK